MKLLSLILIVLMLWGCGDKSKSDKERIVEGTPQTAVPAKPDTISSAREDVAKQPPIETKESPTSAATPANPLINKRWKLIELLGDEVVVTEGFAGDPYITFALRNSKLTGSGGCNRFGCKYRLDGDKIILSGFAATKKRCKDAMSVEETFLRELANVNTYEVDGDSLWLMINGKRVMKFAALYL